MLESKKGLEEALQKRPKPQSVNELPTSTSSPFHTKLYFDCGKAESPTPIIILYLVPTYGLLGNWNSTFNAVVNRLRAFQRFGI